MVWTYSGAQVTFEYRVGIGFSELTEMMGAFELLDNLRKASIYSRVVKEGIISSNTIKLDLASRYELC